MNTIDTELDNIIKSHYLTNNPVSYVIIFENGNINEFIQKIEEGNYFKNVKIQFKFESTQNPYKFYTRTCYDECVVQYIVEKVAIDLNMSYYLSKPVKYVKLMLN